MRKVLLSQLIAIGIFISSFTVSLAQSGQFRCLPTGSGGRICTTISSGCNSGYTGDSSYCNSFTGNSNACGTAPAKDCIADSGSIAAPPGTASGPAFDCAGGKGIKTAIGCIPIGADDDGQSIASFFLKWGLGFAGGVALILIVYSGYMVSTSFGDPRKLQAGKELLTAAISGLILIVMSAYILELIGVEILGIL